MWQPTSIEQNDNIPLSRTLGKPTDHAALRDAKFPTPSQSIESGGIRQHVCSGNFGREGHMWFPLCFRFRESFARSVIDHLSSSGVQVLLGEIAPMAFSGEAENNTPRLIGFEVTPIEGAVGTVVAKRRIKDYGTGDRGLCDSAALICEEAVSLYQVETIHWPLRELLEDFVRDGFFGDEASQVAIGERFNKGEGGIKHLASYSEQLRRGFVSRMNLKPSYRNNEEKRQTSPSRRWISGAVLSFVESDGKTEDRGTILF